MQTLAPVIAPRFSDWPQRLAAFLAARQSAPFVWGSNDCCRFAADGVLAITGHDYMASLRSRYSTALQATRLLKKENGLQRLTSVYLGPCLPTPRQAARGDVVLLPIPGCTVLGLCTGATVACAGPDGVVLVHINAATAAWRV